MACGRVCERDTLVAISAVIRSPASSWVWWHYPCRWPLLSLLVRHLNTVHPSMEAYLERMRRLPFYQPWSMALERYLREDVETLADGQVRPKASGQAIEAELNIGAYYSMCLHFPALSCPVLFIRPRQGLLGEQAHIFTEREASAVVAWISNCWRVDLAGVNHYTMLLHDDPPVIPPIRAFLGEVLRDQAGLK